MIHIKCCRKILTLKDESNKDTNRIFMAGARGWFNVVNSHIRVNGLWRVSSNGLYFTVCIKNREIYQVYFKDLTF